MELWNDIITEKSQNLLFELKKISDFVLIGGWAVWLYTHSAKSKDIDIFIDFNNFFRLQKFFIEKGISADLNHKLNKYEIKLEKIDIDIYTPHHCSLIIPCKDVFQNRWSKSIDGFKTIIPEVLLILKINAEENRHATIKGFKDRIDILSLLHKTQINKELLNSLAKQYNVDLNRLKEIIARSNKEYSYFYPEAENLKRLKELKKELIKNVR